MTLRAIIRQDDAGMATNVGGAVLTTWKTVEFDNPEIERALLSGGHSEQSFSHSQVIGVEVIAKTGEGEW